MADLPNPISVLDIGGSQAYWEMMRPADPELVARLRVTLLNLRPMPVSGHDFCSLAGDARDLSCFRSGEFDLVYSNSTIEHVGSFADQCRMAREVLRVGRRYCIQTPNRYFPVEPHFLFPLFQFLPVVLRVRLLQRFHLGWVPRVSDATEARKVVLGIRLLTRSELRELFPDSHIHSERYLGLGACAAETDAQ